VHDPASWVRFTSADGLPDERVLLVRESRVPDPRALVWALTERGLARYDGHRWHAIDAAHGIQGKRYSDFAVGEDGTVLVVVDDRGWVGSVDEPFRSLEELGEEPLGIVFNCAAVPGGGLAYLTRDRRAGPLEFRIVAESLPEPIVFEPGMFRALQLDAAGEELWLATLEGLSRWDGDHWSLQRPVPSGHRIVRIALADGSGRGLFFVDHPHDMIGLWEWTSAGESRRIEDLLFDGPVRLEIDPGGDAVVLTESGGVLARHAGRWTALQPLPPQMRGIESVDLRGEADLWVATHHGLYLWRERHPLWEHADDDDVISGGVVYQFLRANDGALWLGQKRGFLRLHPDGGSRRLSRLDGEPLGTITALAEDGEGQIWVGTGTGTLDGVLVWDGEALAQVGSEQGLPLSAVHRIRTDRQGRVWFLGLDPDPLSPQEPEPGAWVRLEDGTFASVTAQDGLPSGRVYDFLETPDGSHWFATWGGIARRRGEQWRIWTAADGLRTPVSRTLAMDAEGRMWFGHGHDATGLGWIDEGDAVHYTSGEEAAAHTRVGIVRTSADGRELWVGTDRGLYHRVGSSWTRFGTDTGLHSNHVNTLILEADSITVGTFAPGFSRLAFSGSSPGPPLVELGEPLVEGRRAFLRWKVYPWWGERPRDQIRTRHRLGAGPWSPWSPAREVHLEGLSSGEHSFELEVQDYFGNRHPAAWVDFEILAPIYLRPVWILPTLLALGTSLGLGITFALRRRRAVQALSDSEERYRTLVGAIPDAIVIHRQGLITFVNSVAVELLRASGPEDLIGTEVLELVHPDDREFVAERIQSILAEKGPTPRIEERIQRLDGTIVDVEVTGTLIQIAGQRAVQVVMRDITERKRSDERQALLMRELDHRVKNNLAGVLALAQQTLRATSDLADFERAFTGRLRAMAQVHEALAGARWKAVLLSGLVKLVVAPFAEDGERVSVEGAEVELDRAAVGPLGMALHELLTNASKHGALASAGGRVEVSWHSAEGGPLHLRWLERGGAALAGPADEGLGFSILRGVIAYELGGKVEIAFEPEGLRCDLVIPTVEGPEVAAPPPNP